MAITVALIWVLATFVALPIAVFSRTEKHFFYSSKQQSLGVQWLCLSDFEYKFLYDNILLILQYVLPLVLLSCTFGRIAFAFRTHDRDLHENSMKNEHLRAKHKAIKMLAAIVAIFMICWLPYQLYHAVLERMITSFEVASYSYLVIYWLAMSAAAFNPFIYCFVNARSIVCLSFSNI
ncbi:hypothetical protein AB6A40_010018 [Gnathostoma spinigerum]|uniref:G-protein coupled receptors family 1 profile domain-containing protein n=1 Tax=Gnathostoma spinigerum TaxID=75299 RepID=A0ABD6ETL0_9BILA